MNHESEFREKAPRECVGRVWLRGCEAALAAVDLAATVGMAGRRIAVVVGAWRQRQKRACRSCTEVGLVVKVREEWER